MAIIDAERLRCAFKQLPALDCPTPTAGQIAYRIVWVNRRKVACGHCEHP